LLSLLGERIPEALAEFLSELRAQTKAAGQYHDHVDARLAVLPKEIAAGVDLCGMAREMSEALRQQFVATGLQDSTALLRTSAGEVKTLSSDVAATLQTIAREYRSISSTISGELTKLVAASRQVEEYNYRLTVHDQSSRWLWQVLFAVVLFLMGGLCGIQLEKRQITNALTHLAGQVERIQAPALAPVRAAPARKRE
jgi:uncharacterized protein YukE